ncbi:MAG: YIP1 family protein [Chloroflexi bacterium]|nr:YIP1 family protein [Chloroflexota bacterium]
MTTPSSSPARRFDLPRIFAMILHPRAVFTEMISENRASWLTPMLVLTVTAILAVVTAGYLKTRAATMGEIALPPDWQWWTPEMQENYMRAQQATQGPVFLYVMPLVGSLTGLWLGWLVLAGLLHLGSTLFGGRGSMQNSLNIVSWANLPFALRDLLRVAYMLLAQHTISSPSLSGFATSEFTAQILARVDLFLVWTVILLVVGFAILDGLSGGKSFANVLMVVTLTLLAQAGLGALIAGFGNAAIQRPFF